MATKKTNESVNPEIIENDSEEELVNYMSPLIEGEDTEETVIVNYKVTKFKKGKVVKVKKSVAEVLQARDEAKMYALENQQKFKNQGMEY